MKPEPVVEPEPVVADVTPEPEPVVEPEPEPVVAEAVPEAEPVVAEVAPEAEPVTAQVDEPVAADGDEAPQGPPAADDESVTGGAGGKTDADEGEAESEVVAPATTLAKVKAHAPGLLTAYKAATSTLEKHNLAGTRAKVYLVLDRSASMRPYYKDGSAQALGEQTLALAAHLDPAATVHVVFFSTELDGTGELTLPDHENKIDELHAGLGRMGRTSYHAAVEEVLTHHEKSDAPTAPALVDLPDGRRPGRQDPRHPVPHGRGEEPPRRLLLLRRVRRAGQQGLRLPPQAQDGQHRLLPRGPDPRELTDTEVYEGVLANWRP